MQHNTPLSGEPSGLSHTFSISDKTVATIDSKGVIKAVKPGKAVAAVTSSANKRLSAKFSLTVVKSTKWPAKLVVGQIRGSAYG